MINKKFKIFLLTSIFLLSIFTPLDTIGSDMKNKSALTGFFKSVHKPISIDGDDDFTADNGVIAGNGTTDNPYIIANWNIHISIKDIFIETDGISIKNTKSYFVIDNCFIHFLDGRLAYIITKIKKFYGSNGINLHNTSNGQIKNCLIIGMDGSINIENNSHNNLVANCLCWRNYCGIGINRRSNNNTIERCKTCNYGCSICLWDNTSYNSITNCTCRKVGINVYNSSNNMINRCKLLNCLHYPSMNVFDKSQNNTIKNCTFYHNKHGLKIHNYSDNNLVYSNNFIKNIKPAYDDCKNRWDNGKTGNYWSDFKDIDENMDEIWDHERPICGGDGVDRFPLVNPTFK